MPDPTTNNKPDSFYVDRTVGALNKGRSIDGEKGLRGFLMAEPNMSEERVNKIIGEAARINQEAQDNLPSEASKTDFGLFGGTDYEEYKEKLGTIDKRLIELTSEINAADNDTTSIGYRGEAYLPLIEEKQQLQLDRHTILDQRGRVLREIAARVKEGGTSYGLNDGTDNPNYGHSAELQFLRAGVNYINDIDPSYNAEVTEDGEIIADFGGRRQVVQPEFFDTVKAQRYETAGILLGAAYTAGRTAKGASKGRAFGPVGTLLGATWGLIKSGAPSAILGGAGAYLDSEDTIGMLEETYANQQLNLRKADGLLKSAGMEVNLEVDIPYSTEKVNLGVPYSVEKAVDAAIADTGIGLASYAVGKVTGKTILGIVTLWDKLRGKSGTSDEAVQFLLKDTNLTYEQALSGMKEWVDTIPEDELVSVGNRLKILDWSILPEGLKKANTQRKSIKDLEDKDKIAMYLLHTHPSLRGALVEILKADKADNARVLIESALNRGRAVDDMLKDSAPYLPAHITQNLITFRKEIKRARTNFSRSLDLVDNGFRTNDPVKLSEAAEALDNSISTAASQDFLSLLRSRAGMAARNNVKAAQLIEVPESVNKTYLEDVISGEQFMHLYDNFIIKGHNKPQYNKRELQELEQGVARLIGEKYGSKALKEFATLTDLHKRYTTLSGQAMFKELRTSGLNSDDVSSIFLKYAANKQAKDSPFGYRRTVKALVDAVFERRNLVNKNSRVLTKDDPLKKIKAEEGDSLDDFDKFNKAVERGIGFDAEESLELGAIKALVDVHSINVGGLGNLRGGVSSTAGQRVIDFAALRESVRPVQWRSKKAREAWELINKFGTIYRNDIGIVAAVESAGTSLNVSSGASIATSVEGKFKVQFASTAYEIILSHLGSNQYSKAREVTDALTQFMHGDPVRIKPVMELLKEAELNKAKNRAEEIKDGLAIATGTINNFKRQRDPNAPRHKLKDYAPILGKDD